MRATRLRGSAVGISSLTTLRRRSIDSRDRFRPRFGRFDSSASRYARTARPASRPSASAALCSSVISRLAEAFLAAACGLPHRAERGWANSARQLSEALDPTEACLSPPRHVGRWREAATPEPGCHR